MAETRRNTRVIDDVAPLDYGQTLAFFEGRARRADELDRRTITMYQDNRADLAKRRDESEVAHVVPFLRLDRRSTRVLDIGCGVGRWGCHLSESVRKYIGIDFSDGLVSLANERLSTLYPDGHGRALTMSATEVGSAGFERQGYDLIILSGIMAYLNDADCGVLLDSVSQLVAPFGQVYIREPMARTHRLTLREHWSDELAAEYSAVYRSIEKYAELVDDHLAPSGFTIAKSFELSPELANRSETCQFVMMLDQVDDR